MPFNFSKFLTSLRRAAGALLTALREEQNFRLQGIGAVVVFLVSLWLRISLLELALAVSAVVAAMILELVNSAVERLVDMAQPRVHHYAAAIKNLMAGAVLLTALLAVFVVLAVWWPYLVAV